MSFLNKLKEILLPDEFAKVKKELNGKDLFVNDGENYVPKKTFNEELDKNKALKTEKEDSERKIIELEKEVTELKKDKDSGDKSVEQKITALEKKLDEQKKSIDEKDNELLISKKEGVLKESLIESGVKNPKNLKLLMKEFDLANAEMEDGKLKGYEEKVKVLKEDYKSLFGEDIITGTIPEGSGQPLEGMEEMSTKDFYAKDVFGK